MFVYIFKIMHDIKCVNKKNVPTAFDFLGDFDFDGNFFVDFERDFVDRGDLEPRRGIIFVNKYLADGCFRVGEDPIIVNQQQCYQSLTCNAVY